MLKTRFTRNNIGHPSNTCSNNYSEFFVQLLLIVSIYKGNYVIVYFYFLISFILIAHCSFYGPFIVALYILITQDLMHLFDGSNINMGFNRLQKYYMHTR